jgi:hypothetical protein
MQRHTLGLYLAGCEGAFEAAIEAAFEAAFEAAIEAAFETEHLVKILTLGKVVAQAPAHRAILCV